MRDNFDLKKIIEWLGLILRCPICGVKYNLDQTKVVDSQQDDMNAEAHILIHSDCTKCKSSIMFNIDIHGPEVFSVGMITDLTSGDSKRLHAKEPISADDVIGIHKALKKFDGNFVKAISSADRGSRTK